jgi:hypothetical protein
MLTSFIILSIMSIGFFIVAICVPMPKEERVYPVIIGILFLLAGCLVGSSLLLN